MSLDRLGSLTHTLSGLSGGGMEQPLLYGDGQGHAARGSALPPARITPFSRGVASFGSSISDVFRTATQAPRLTESLDYENIQNQVRMDTEKEESASTRRHFYGWVAA